jgi:N-acetylneuraminic acid mutarotase
MGGYIMFKKICPVTVTLLVVSAHGVSSFHSLGLTFDQRVEAQEAIERVYYSHQIGATRPFEEVVPREVLVGKVRTYLRQTVALERYWNTPVTTEMLQREYERMSRTSRMPNRLLELFSALNDDPLLIRECLARQLLVDRLARGFFAYDQRLHAESWKQAERLREQLEDGRLDIHSEHRGKTLIELMRNDLQQDGRAEDGATLHAVASTRLLLSEPDFKRWRARAPGQIGAVGPVIEEREAFEVYVVVEEWSDRTHLARYAVRKSRWDDWWNGIERELDSEPEQVVAKPGKAFSIGSQSTPEASASVGALIPEDPSAKLDAPCAPDDTWDNGSLDDVPDGRQYPTAVWTGTHMIVWGGRQYITIAASGGRYDPVTDTWAPVSGVGAPSGGYEHTAVWTGTEMIVWGGLEFYPSSRTNTGGRYNPLTDSWTATSTDGAPSPRNRHTAVWTGNEVVVWSGYDGSYTTTGGRYDPSTDTWTPTSTTGAPSGRRYHRAVWTGTEMIVWGGENPGTLDTGGRYDPSVDTWIPTSITNAPTPRAKHSMVWTGDEMIVWGGNSITGGRYDPSTDSWSPTSMSAVPHASTNHTTVWTGTEMIVWGPNGTYPTGGRYDPSSDSWSPVSHDNTPLAFSGHTAVWTGDLMVVWGGVYSSSYYPITGGRYDPASDSWTPTGTSNEPWGRYEHSAVWTGSHMIVWGGYSTGRLDTGGRYDPATDSWTPTNTTNAPTPRYNHTAVWAGGKMIVWGGRESVTLNTGGRYDPLTDVWATTSLTDVPEQRYRHTAVSTGDRMIVWGGSGYLGDELDTGGFYDPSGDVWTTTSTTGAPVARSGHSAVWTGERMIVWGGDDGTDLLSSGGQYEPVAGSWTPMTLSDAPTGRASHVAVWTGDEMIVWGGGTDSGGRYDPVADDWSAISTVDAPSARILAEGVWTGKHMIVWGGCDSTSFVSWHDTGGRYDPNGDTWTATSLVGVPIARYGHTAIWNGSHMIVWGGYNGGYLASGGRYAMGHSIDDDLDGWSECDGDCDDVRMEVYPGAEQLCDGINNDCSDLSWPAVPGDEVDADGDGAFLCTPDCDDADPAVYPDAPEINDGMDNQCPGDFGHGVVDETSGDSGFHNPADESEYSWTAQTGATNYEAARSTMPDFSSDCTTITTSDTYWVDSESPAIGSVFYYLNRPLNPNIGSWGQDSTGAERVNICP